MANATVNERGSASTPSNEGTTVDRIAIEGALISMKGLNDLAGWIGRARDFIEGVEAGRRSSPVLAEQLKRCDFANNVVDWDEDVAEGMICLHSALNDCLDTISNAMRAEVQS